MAISRRSVVTKASPLDLGDAGQQRLGRLVGLGRPAARALDQGASQAILLLEQHLENVLGRELLMAA
jgi:hypothetical protein